MDLRVRPLWFSALHIHVALSIYNIIALILCSQYSCSAQTGLSIIVEGRSYLCSCEGEEVSL